MRKDHRPYLLKKASAGFVSWYARRYLIPQFRSMGKDPVFIRPWNVNVFGYNVTAGDHVMIIASPDANVNLISWAQADLADLSDIVSQDRKGVSVLAEKASRSGKGIIEIGDYALICPGVRIHSATSVTIGSGAMLANSSYVTDSDWHGIYDRAQPVGLTAPVVIGENAWIGDHAIVTKGVTVGKNSIVGAGAVVTRSIPDNCVAAGNPAKVVKHLDENRPVNGRGVIYQDFEATRDLLEAADRDAHRGHTFVTWLRAMLFPRYGD
ncbi:MAG: acyltransferase [Thermodesulfobacteriota bacterium]